MKKAEADGRRVPALIWILLLSVAYQFLGSGRLGREVSLAPEGMQRFASGDPTRQNGIPYGSFALAGSAGFLDGAGNLVASMKADGVSAIGNDRWASAKLDSPGYTVLSPGGGMIHNVAAPGFPLFSAGREFSLRPDQRGIAEVDETGRQKWSVEFPSILTSFSATGELAAAGMLDGSISLIGKDGKAFARGIPGASRIACIYGIALSDDGAMVAVVSGKDPQRLVTYRVTGNSFVEISRMDLGGFSPEPAEIAFLPGADGVFAYHGASWHMLDFGSGNRMSIPAGDGPDAGTKLALVGGETRLLAGLRTDAGEGRARLIATGKGGVIPIMFDLGTSDVDFVPQKEGMALVNEQGAFRYRVVYR